MSQPDDPSRKEARIVEARMRLRERFEARQAATPARADTAPEGTGPANRHGMPRLPPGQYEVTGWPVLDLGTKPVVSKDVFRLQLFGACEHPQVLDWAFALAEEIEKLESPDTGWNLLDEAP